MKRDDPTAGDRRGRAREDHGLAHRDACRCQVASCESPVVITTWKGITERTLAENAVPIPSSGLYYALSTPAARGTTGWPSKGRNAFGFRNVDNHRRRIRWARTRQHRRASAILNDLPVKFEEPG